MSREADPRRGRRARRSLRGPAPVEEAAPREAEVIGGRPAAAHDLPAVPAGGRGRQHLARGTRWCRCGGSCARCTVVAGAVTADRARRAGPPPCSRSSARPGRSRTTTSWSRPARSRGPCRSPGCASTRRLQDHRRGDLAAQPRAGPARRGRRHDGPGRPAAGADLRLRRRRLRRHRGAGRDGGHGPRRAALLPGAAAATDMRWVLVEATQRVLPEVGRDMGAYTVQQLLQARAWTSGWTPGWSPAWTAWWSSPTATASRPTRSSGPPGSSRHPMLDAHRPARATTRAGSPACRRCRWSTATGCVEGAWSAGDCAAVPDLTDDAGRALLAQRPARGPPGAGGWPTTSSRCCAGGAPVTTGTSTSAQRGQPRPAQGRRPGVRHQADAAARPGSCTGRTT